MATKLKFLFRDPQSALLLKTLVFGGALLFVFLSGFRPLSLAIFLFLSGFFYLRPLTNAFVSPSLLSFAILIGCVVFLSPLLSGAAPFAVWVVVFSLLFHLILGIKEVLFVHRVRWHAVEAFTLLYILLLAFFLADHGTYPLLKFIGASLTTFFLLRGVVRFSAMSGNVMGEEIRNLVAAALTFIAAELLWIVGFLPLSVPSAAALVTVILLILTDTSVRFSRSDISAKAVVFNIVILIFLAALLLLASSWKP